MTVVFVNGNPETAAIWEPVREQLSRDDVTCLSPPGFGASIPDGFECSVLGYRDWLVAALEEQSGPVDLVGHDVGGSITMTVAMARPDLLRTWISDSLGVFDPDYVWHDLARRWQTAGEGERAVSEWMGGPGPPPSRPWLNSDEIFLRQPFVRGSPSSVPKIDSSGPKRSGAVPRRVPGRESLYSTGSAIDGGWRTRPRAPRR